MIELLKEILEQDVKEYRLENNELIYILENDTAEIPDLHSINMYELSHKCKVWANFNNYIIDVNYRSENEVNVYWMSKLNNKMSFKYNSEPESVFEACKYILEQIKNKGK